MIDRLGRPHMRIAIVVCVVLAATAAVIVAQSPAPLQSPRNAGCSEWRDCRQLALAAVDRGDYQAFHDLAWRAVQTGPPRDPALMYLLARAQALSGRPHDALIMLQRLAEMGVPSDGDTNEDFSLTRQLPGWAEVSARIARLNHPDLPPDATPAATPAPSRAAAPAAPVETPRAAAPAATPESPRAGTAVAAPVSLSPAPASPSSTAAFEAVRFSAGGFRPGGVAYDAVSRRFLFGDRLGRKLFIVGEGSNHTVDFVRADSAGFHDISAIEIDTKRGDLWVTSASPSGRAATLHKLQLVSGRPLKSFQLGVDLEPVAPVDLAVTPAGAVLVLDAAGRKVLVLRAGAPALERVMQIDAQEPVSLAVGGDDGVAYVAHRDGVLRIDLRTRTATEVRAPRSISLSRLERIRWHRHALIGIRADADGLRRIVRLDLNPGGRSVTRATTLEGTVPAEGPAFATVSGDELVYLVDGSADTTDATPREATAMAEVVAYRVHLK
jgi:hypothetical protein